MTKIVSNGQNGAATSAKTSFLLSASYMFPFWGYNEKKITELNKTDIVRFIAISIRECKSRAQFTLEFGDERYCIFLNKDDRGYYVTVKETSSKTVQRPVKEIIRHYFDCFRMIEKNIENIANYVYDLVADYFYGVYEAETANTETEISEAPILNNDTNDEVEEQTEENEVEFEDGNYIVIAHTADGDIIIGKDGENHYDDFETALAVKRDHDNMGAEVVVYMVQKTMNEYGVVSDEFIRCTEVEEQEQEYDIDRGIERVADTIEKYLGSYTPSYLDKFGECTITIYWDEFNEQDMKMLIEDSIFALAVRDTLYERGVIKTLSGFLVYDDGVYVDLPEDYFKRREEQRNLAIELAEEDYEMKNYKERENYEEEDLKEYLANMLGRVYAHRCLKDDEEISIGDVVYMVKVFMEKLQELRGADLEYDALVLAKDKDMRVRAEFYEGFKTMESEIMIALLNAKIFDAKCVAEGLNRMYWDTIIWENDDVAVKYTSPCEDFERGCLLVVEKESECMLGGWIDVSSNQDAVEHVVEEIEEFYENKKN